MAKPTCYMCCRDKTSVEHVPPRCLFPEQKDLADGIDLRKQLITVPSCNIHNSQKSHDDEYLLYALLLNIPNNETAKNHTFTKIMRAVEKNPAIIAGLQNSEQIPVTCVSKTGEKTNTIAVQIDEARLRGSLESIGCALYYHHFKSKWEGQIDVHLHFLKYITECDAADLNKPGEKLQAHIEKLMADQKKHGENPEVFCYQVTDGAKPYMAIMYLRIYEGSRITLLFKKQC